EIQRPWQLILALALHSLVRPYAVRRAHGLLLALRPADGQLAVAGLVSPPGVTEGLHHVGGGSRGDQTVTHAPSQLGRLFPGRRPEDRNRLAWKVVYAS